MAKFLFILGLVTFAAVLVLWAGTGADPGWTKTQSVTMEVDPVTELQFPVYTDKLTLGVDFLAAGLFGSCILIALSFLLRKIQHHRTNPS